MNKITIDDIARDLGISKTTVSRSISGKGRISRKTRRMVLDYIKEHDYTPNPIARGLAQSKTYNIGWVVPGDSENFSLPYFQLTMFGMCEAAQTENYDVLLIMSYDSDISRLENMLKNRKVDGVVLGRTWENDLNIKALKENGIP
ncbi:MAG: LacI family DNA-binding transcriptional regulator, partial [Clostridiales bacterium]|nr:LacI family DNA-binding transcriptional regulator [Clostridiales bacterium]